MGGQHSGQEGSVTPPTSVTWRNRPKSKACGSTAAVPATAWLIAALNSADSSGCRPRWLKKSVPKTVSKATSPVRTLSSRCSQARTSAGSVNIRTNDATEP